MPETEHPESLSSEQLLPLVYEELRRLATSRMASQAAGMTLQPTAPVPEPLGTGTGVCRDWVLARILYREAQAMVVIPRKIDCIGNTP